MKIKRRTLAFIVRGIINVTIVSAIVALFYVYFATQVFTITSYQISGLDETSRTTVNAQLRALDTKKIYKIFPLNKIFTYSSSVITNTIRSTVPEMATVSIRPVGLHTLKIEVTLLKPIFRVSDTQALTEDGVIFTTKYNIRSYSRVIIASSTVKTFKNDGVVFTKIVLPDGGEVKDFFTQLNALTTKMSTVIFPIESILVEKTGDVSCFSKEEKSKIIFLKESDYKKVWSTLLSAIDTDPLKTKLANDKDNLEYLDVRYGNKVFYRFSDMAFQNGSVTGILENHATTTQSITATTSSQ